MSALAATAHVARRELRLEVVGREATSWVLPMAAAVVLLVGLGAGPDRALLAGLAPTAVWVVTVVTAALLGVSTIRAERDEGCWTLLQGMVPQTAVMAGKAAAIWMQLAVGWLLTAGAAAVTLTLSWSPVAVAGGLLGTLGLAPVAVLVGGAVGDHTRRAGLALALLLPLTVAPVLAGVQLLSDPAFRWVALLAGYAALTWVAAWATYPAVVEG